MFTVEQIKAAHSKVKSGADFPNYVQDLKALGVISYDNYVADGHTDYRGSGNYQTSGPAKYPVMNIANISSAEKLQHDLSAHQQGQTDYMTFCKQAAEAGVEKWTVHVIELTCTYFDKAGNKLLAEVIPTKA